MDCLNLTIEQCMLLLLALLHHRSKPFTHANILTLVITKYLHAYIKCDTFLGFIECVEDIIFAPKYRWFNEDA